MQREDEFGLWVSDDGESWQLVERTDDSGRWLTSDNGVSWRLVEPSAAFLQRRADAAASEPAFAALDALGRMATLSAILHGDVDDWANASGYQAAHLIHEAQAWAL